MTYTVSSGTLNPTQLNSRWNWKNTTGSSWTCFGVRMPRTSNYPNINLIRTKVHHMMTMHASPRHTDGRTNIMAIAGQFILRMHCTLKTFFQYNNNTRPTMTLCICVKKRDNEKNLKTIKSCNKHRLRYGKNIHQLQSMAHHI